MKYLILLATVFVIGMNAAANLLPFNGLSTAEISDSFSVFFVPAGYVFSIWGLIYLLLISFTVYSLTNKANDLVNKVAPYYVLSCILNSIWLLAWHYLWFGASVVIMILLLLTLIKIYLLVSSAENLHWSIKHTFSVYLGWISVATIANITAYLSYIGWSGFGISGEIWAAILIVVAGLLAIVSILRHADYAYSAVIMWAIIGIALKFSGSNTIIYTVAAVSVAMLSVGIYKYSQSLRTIPS